MTSGMTNWIEVYDDLSAAMEPYEEVQIALKPLGMTRAKESALVGAGVCVLAEAADELHAHGLIMDHDHAAIHNAIRSGDLVGGYGVEITTAQLARAVLNVLARNEGETEVEARASVHGVRACLRRAVPDLRSRDGLAD